MAKIIICKEAKCHNASTTDGYCRLHYLRHWRELKEVEHLRAAKKLNRYIDGVMKKHPDRYLEVIKKDLRSPGFEKIVESLGGEDEDEAGIFLDELAYDEEVEELIKQLKVEKGF